MKGEWELRGCERGLRDETWCLWMHSARIECADGCTWRLSHFYIQPDFSNDWLFNISDYTTLDHPYLQSISPFFPTPTLSPNI
jgi:hypothetical protein